MKETQVLTFDPFGGGCSHGVFCKIGQAHTSGLASLRSSREVYQSPILGKGMINARLVRLLDETKYPPNALQDWLIPIYLHLGNSVMNPRHHRVISTSVTVTAPCAICFFTYIYRENHVSVLQRIINKGHNNIHAKSSNSLLARSRFALHRVEGPVGQQFPHILAPFVLAFVAEIDKTLAFFFADEVLEGDNPRRLH